MLSRRHLRIKVLHALYEWSHNPDQTLAKGLQRLNASIDNIYRLYFLELKLLVEILRIAEDEIERRKQKKLPTEEDLNPPLNFVKNGFLNWLADNNSFIKAVEQNKISWREEREILRKIFREFTNSEEYQQYQRLSKPGIKDDRKVIRGLYGGFVVNSGLIHQIYEDRDIHWADDLDAAQMIVSKTMKRYNEDSDEMTPLPRLIKDKDDLDFARTLYTKVVNNSKRYEEMIREKARHWELERIAQIDMILMKQALAELISFNEIPVKVTLNEYIELSKEYSTPKSGNFINGVLDKLKDELTAEGEIRKIGRGLL